MLHNGLEFTEHTFKLLTTIDTVVPVRNLPFFISRLELQCSTRCSIPFSITMILFFFFKSLSGNSRITLGGTIQQFANHLQKVNRVLRCDLAETAAGEIFELLLNDGELGSSIGLTLAQRLQNGRCEVLILLPGLLLQVVTQAIGPDGVRVLLVIGECFEVLEITLRILPHFLLKIGRCLAKLGAHLCVRQRDEEGGGLRSCALEVAVDRTRVRELVQLFVEFAEHKNGASELGVQALNHVLHLELSEIGCLLHRQDGTMRRANPVGDRLANGLIAEIILLGALHQTGRIDQDHVQCAGVLVLHHDRDVGLYVARLQQLCELSWFHLNVSIELGQNTITLQHDVRCVRIGGIVA
mmetsp:Transcript_10016/g.24961  ORF Transcript_10016/g.24961 Transcript_10016/m.24961 type:complete len:354 (+) Transcript_10016:906-1967(+)